MTSSELACVVAEDLQYLKLDWNGNIGDAALRRGSTVLRRLLVEGDLQRAWKQSGLPNEPHIPAFIIEPALSLFDEKRIVFATAGGAVHGGGQMTGQVMLDYAASREELERHCALGLPTATLGLRRFSEGTCIAIRNLRITRRHVVKYVANKLGGAHHDAKRGKDHEESLYATLDQFRDNLLLLGKPLVYFELLSIGQAVGNAPDIEALHNRLAGHAAT